MALLKRGNVFHVRKQVGGVLIARSTKTTNKRQAELLEAKWTQEVYQEVVIAGRKPITVEKAIKLFLDSRRGTAGHGNAEIKLRMYSDFNSQMLHEVDKQEIQDHALDLVQDEYYSVNTINTSLVYWNAVMNFCQQAGYTPGCKVKKLKGGSNRVRFLSEEEEQKLLKALDPHCGAYREKTKAQNNLDFTIALLHTGAREQEIATLKLSQVDFEANTITIHRSKNGTDTTLVMSNELLEVVKRRKDNEYLFPERSKGRYNNGYLAKAAFRAGLKDISCHTMRHTFATKMLKAGLTLHEVGHALGHKNISSTMIYAHLVPTQVGARVAQVLNTRVSPTMQALDNVVDV